MNQQYIGKTCPYCQFPIKNEDTLFICPDCKQPHHPDCWKENNGCTTFSCECKTIPQESGHNSRLVINLQDLPVDEYGAHIYPSLSSDYNSSNYASNDSLVSNMLLYIVLAGVLGGLVTWLIAIEYFSFTYYATTELHDQIIFETALFAAILGGVICSALSAVEGMTSKVFAKTLSGMLKGAIIGFFGGFFGAVIGHYFYDSLEGVQVDSELTHYILRGLFWSFVGFFIGIGQGVGSGGGKKIVNGLIGGSVGGFVGGFLFDYFFLIFTSAEFSGFFAIIVFGLSVGLAIGLVHEMRKEAWLKVLEGATIGKEYVIQSDKTIIGSSPKCDIVLIRDPEIMPTHAEIILGNNVYVITDLYGSNGLMVGNRKVSRGQIKNGDIIKIGSYQMRFHEKVVR